MQKGDTCPSVCVTVVGGNVTWLLSMGPSLGSVTITVTLHHDKSEVSTRLKEVLVQSWN